MVKSFVLAKPDEQSTKLNYKDMGQKKFCGIIQRKCILWLLLSSGVLLLYILRILTLFIQTVCPVCYNLLGSTIGYLLLPNKATPKVNILTNLLFIIPSGKITNNIFLESDATQNRGGVLDWSVKLVHRIHISNHNSLICYQEFDLLAGIINICALPCYFMGVIII